MSDIREQLALDEIRRLEREVAECIGLKGQEREFLFEYRFEGDIYGLPVIATSIDEARRKVSAMTFATYKGEIFAKVPATPKGWWQRLLGSRF